jgi:hypothetical protein
MEKRFWLQFKSFIETPDSFTVEVAFDFDDCGNELRLRSHEN